MKAWLFGLALALLPAAAGARPVQVSDYGTAADGTKAHLYTLTNQHGAVVRISDWGGLVVAIEVPDRAGQMANVALGFGSLAEYQARNGDYGFGSPIGRYANRIAGARFTLDGQEVRLVPNDGPNLLHGGPPGYNVRPWAARPFDHGRESGVALDLVSPAGDQGFPGTLRLTVTYTLGDRNDLRIDYRATTDAPTAINFTNHSYFNLAGAGSGSVLDERVAVFANRRAELDGAKLPTGRVIPVTGGFDLRKERAFAEAIAASPEISANGGFDHPYVLADKPRRTPTLVTRISDPTSGRVMEVLTTEPSLQLYTGNHFRGIDHAPTGGVYVRNGGVAVEAQHLPDSVNHPQFPSTVLRPGEVFRSTTVYRFGVLPGQHARH